MKKINIVGAGISGLSAAKLLSDKNEVIVFEQAPKPGGLIACKNVNGNLYHQVGGHAFNSKNTDVLNWFKQFFNLSEDFHHIERNAKIFLDKTIVSYPIENHLFQLNPKLTRKIIEEFLEINRSTVIDGSNFGGYLQSQFGQTLNDLYFKPYNNKLWPIPLHEIPLDWLAGKFPTPNITQIIEANILRKKENNQVHALFYYPKSGGSQFIADTLAKDLTIIYDKTVNSIRCEGESIVVDDKFKSDCLVFTGDVSGLHAILETGDGKIKHLLQRVSRLPSKSTTNVLCLSDPVDCSWVYIPKKEIRAHRIIYTGNFSSQNNSDQKRRSCVVEFSGEIGESEIEDTIQKLPGNLKVLEKNNHTPTYIAHGFETGALVTDLQNELMKKNIFLLGRFAEWKYYNMDNCIESAFAVAEKINHV